MTDSLIQQLDTLLAQMLENIGLFVSLAQAIGGLGSLCFVFFRIWGHLARNEEIDIYPLLRPVAIAFCLAFYPLIKDGVIAISKGLDKQTQSFVSKQANEVKQLEDKKKGLVLQARKTKVGIIDKNNDGNESWSEIISAMWNSESTTQFAADMVTSAVQNMVDQIMRLIAEMIYTAAFLILKFLVTFFIIVLLITGPLTIGLASFDWFYSGLAAWVNRLIHMMMWIPLTNLLSGMLKSVHIIMLQKDIEQLQKPDSGLFTADDFSLVIFYILGTCAYMTIPTAAGWIVESTGAGEAVSKTLAGGKLGASMAGGGLGWPLVV